MVGPTTSITRIGAVALLILVQACGGAATTPTSTGPTPSPTTEPTPSLPADAAPDELQGRWSTLIGPGDNVTLIIGQTGYSIVRRGFSGHLRSIFSQGDDHNVGFLCCLHSLC